MHALVLLATELVANSVRHAGLTVADRIGFQVRRRDDWLRIDVIDRGRRFEPRVPTVADLEAQSARGLAFVDRMADRWGISERPGKRHCWFELRVPQDEPASAPAAPDG